MFDQSLNNTAAHINPEAVAHQRNLRSGNARRDPTTMNPIQKEALTKPIITYLTWVSSSWYCPGDKKQLNCLTKEVLQ